MTISQHASDDERNNSDVAYAEQIPSTQQEETDAGGEGAAPVQQEETALAQEEGTGAVSEATASTQQEVTDAGSEGTAPVQQEETAPAQEEVINAGNDETSSALNIQQPVGGSEGRFWPPSRAQLLTGIAFWGVILLGAVLRFWGLGDKPLHHDESLHAYFSLQLMHDIENWSSCFSGLRSCYKYDPLLHGPFQFHAIALVYKLSQILGAPDHGVNTTTVRIVAASLGTTLVGLPYFLRDRLGVVGAWLACFLLAVSPSMVYFSRFAREDIYMACFTLLMVVGTAQYLRNHQAKWLILAAWGFALSYTTNEATFLTVAVFGSFLGALLAWELGARWSIGPQPVQRAAGSPHLPRTGSLAALLIYFLVLGAAAKWFFAWLEGLASYITTHTAIADQFVANLKARTIVFILVLVFVLLIYVLSLLWHEAHDQNPSAPLRRGLAAHIDPEQQPLLNTICTLPWRHWFLAFIVAGLTFLILFTVLFTNIWGGITDGVWQGLYYWLQQQQVARGGEPWYYYILLIPLYEQIGLVFGIVGIVRSLLRPTRFRLFLVYWFIGDLFIYSWAAEKMPWLVIHIALPMILLAAIGLEPALVILIQFARERLAATKTLHMDAAPGQPPAPVLPALRRSSNLASGGALLTVVLAVLLLLPTLQNMYQLSYIHQADAPHEMMIYVQTTTDVNTVMAKVDALDQKLHGGKHLLTIGVLSDGTWPFAWYLRDYTRVCFNFPSACPSMVKDTEVIIAGGDNLPNVYATYGSSYTYHQYHMRTQWDQGYMPPPCQPSATNPCTTPQPYVGVGPLLWLSYGDNPPPGATFNAALAAKNIWQWWWQRKAFGNTTGSYDMALLIRNDLATEP